MVVGQTNRVGLPAGQPDRHIPPEWFFDVGPSLFVPLGFG